jgi:O-antigen ligase
MSSPASKKATLKSMPKDFALKVFLYGLGLVTLFFYSTIVDPFNAPKAWILDLCAAWLLGFVVIDYLTNVVTREEKMALIIFGAFLLTMVAALIHTNYLYTGIFGAYGRRTGFLSYLCLAIFSIAGVRLIRLANLAKTDIAFLFIGSLASVYGIAQHYKIDFVHWNNPFNSVISTVGNPDFASAMMGVISVLAFGIGVNSKRLTWIRSWGIFIFITCDAAVLMSHSLQGLLISILGVGFIVLVFAYQKSKALGHVLLSGGLIVAIGSIFGMLQIGPLKNYVYKISVTYRGDYWRAGWNMFIHNPLFGVGLDRYGQYYRFYRDKTATLRRGPDEVSNAAHNVFIQLAATGGIFVVLAYLAIVAFIIWRGFVALKLSRGPSQMAAVTVFAAWIAYLAQSIISIDNLGVAIWGWVLGGMVIGMSLRPQAKPDEVADEGEKSSIKKKRPSVELSYLLSGVLAIGMFVVVLFMAIGDKQIAQVSELQLPPNQQDVPIFVNYSERPMHQVFIDPMTAITVADKLASGNQWPPAISILKNYLKQDPSSFEFVATEAQIYEYTNQRNLALAPRLKSTQLDPLNTTIKLRYAEDLASTGQMAAAKQQVAAIDAIDPHGADAQKAHAEIK